MQVHLVNEKKMKLYFKKKNLGVSVFLLSTFCYSFYISPLFTFPYYFQPFTKLKNIKNKTKKMVLLFTTGELTTAATTLRKD